MDAQVCDVARASTAVSALSWLAWAVTFVFGVIGVVKGRSGGGKVEGKGEDVP